MNEWTIARSNDLSAYYVLNSIEVQKISVNFFEKSFFNSLRLKNIVQLKISILFSGSKVVGSS